MFKLVAISGPGPFFALSTSVGFGPCLDLASVVGKACASFGAKLCVQKYNGRDTTQWIGTGGVG